MKNVIMLHALFRSGSTYMFNKFRQDSQFWCYYEPFHHDVARLRRDALEIWKYDEKTTAGMSHPVLHKPHFYEYNVAFRDGEEALPYFNAVFSYDEFTKVLSIDETFGYVSRLIDVSPTGTKPVLQFNRSSLRLHWFREKFDGALHLFMLRNPRDQFESYLKRGVLKKNWFLAINLYIYLKNTHYFESIDLDRRLLGLKLTSGGVVDNLKACLVEVRAIPLNRHYEIFLHIWLLSLIEADKYADMIINMDEVNDSAEHTREIHDKLSSYCGDIKLSFHDFNITHYEVLSLTKTEYEEVENRVVALYKKLLSDKVERAAIHSMRSRADSIKKLSFIKRLSRMKSRFLMRL